MHSAEVSGEGEHLVAEHGGVGQGRRNWQVRDRPPLVQRAIKGRPVGVSDGVTEIAIVADPAQEVGAAEHDHVITNTDDVRLGAGAQRRIGQLCPSAAFGQINRHVLTASRQAQHRHTKYSQTDLSSTHTSLTITAHDWFPARPLPPKRSRCPRSVLHPLLDLGERRERHRNGRGA